MRLPLMNILLTSRSSSAAEPVKALAHQLDQGLLDGKSRQMYQRRADITPIRPECRMTIESPPPRSNVYPFTSAAAVSSKHIFQRDHFEKSITAAVVIGMLGSVKVPLAPVMVVVTNVPWIVPSVLPSKVWPPRVTPLVDV